MEQFKIESGLQLFARVQEQAGRNTLNFPMFPNGITSRETIEIVGDSKAGTAVLLDLIVRCILPKQIKGNEASVILINTEQHISLPLILSCIQQHLNGFEVNPAELIESCLKRLTVLNCYNSNQLKFTFLSLERFLQENEDIAVIFVDSVASYYWMDRQGLGVISFNNYCATIANSLFSIVKDFNVTVIFTSINTDLVIRSKGMKRNYILNLSVKGDCRYCFQLFEDSAHLCEKEILVNPFVNYL